MVASKTQPIKEIIGGNNQLGKGGGKNSSRTVIGHRTKKNNGSIVNARIPHTPPDNAQNTKPTYETNQMAPPTIAAFKIRRLRFIRCAKSPNV